MKKTFILFLTTALLFLASCNTTESHSDNSMTTLYPAEATVTKDGHTIKVSDLSELPIFKATYEGNSNAVIVLRDGNRLMLSQSGTNNYYQSGQYGNLRYSIDAYVNNGMVTKITYIETQDDMTVRIIYITN